MKQFLRIEEHPVWLILFFALIGLIPLFWENNIDLFFVCFGTGISIAVVMCAITQNKIQKDNIKIQLFDKRFIVYQSLLDSITIIKRDNWDRYILFNGNDVSQQMMQLEENLYKSVQLSFCLFDKELCSKIVDVNNAFNKVAESYKEMFVANREHFTSQNEIQKFTNLLNTYILSKKGFNTPEYEDAFRKQFPRTYISIMDFNKECSAYLSFVDKCGIIKDFRKYIFIDKIG